MYLAAHDEISLYRLAADVCSSRNEIGAAFSMARGQALEKAPYSMSKGQGRTTRAPVTTALLSRSPGRPRGKRKTGP